MAITVNIKKGFPHYSEDDEGIRTYDLEYDIITTAGEGVRTVALSLPQRGAFYSADGEIDLQAIATSPRVERDTEVNARWKGWQTFSTQKKRDCTENEDDDPLQEPAVVTWPTNVTSELFIKDLDDNPVANAAGELFDPPVEIDDYLLGCQIIRNVADWNPLAAHRYYGKMNSDTFRIDRWTFPKETARLIEWSGEKFYHQDCNFYYRTTMQLMFKERTTFDGNDVSGHDLQLLNAGYYEKDADGGLKEIRLKGGGQTPGPHPLDADGLKAADGADPIFLKFRRYEKTNFAGLFAGIRW